MQRKISKTRWATGIAAGITCAVFAAIAAAGPHYSDPGVTIAEFAEGGGIVWGTLGGTRNSADPIERLSCSVTRTESGTRRITTVSCLARDANDITVSCTSSSEALANALSSTPNDSLIEFRYDVNGTCTEIGVYESSSLERKR